MHSDIRESLDIYNGHQLTRYGSERIKTIFSKQSFLKYYLSVEMALLIGLVEAGIAERECIEYYTECTRDIKVEEWEEAEKRYGHEIASLSFLLGEKCPRCARYIHLGATSNDIIDTAWALIIRDALNVIEDELKAVINKLISLTIEYQDVIAIGRTHGQHALPITLGFKFANYVYELTRTYERLMECKKRVIRGKIGGAVGTKAAWGDRGIVVENSALRHLRLEPHIISTQVAPRDGFAELVLNLSILGSQLDRLGLEVRELSRTEIGEMAEGFDRIGSSTMPHKRNPVVSERVSGLARVMRALAVTALENIPLMHERDLTNSSSERIAIPLAFILIDQMLNDVLNVLENIVIDKERMRANLELTGGASLSEALMVKLALKGIPRHIAYLKVRELIRRAYERGINFKEAVIEDEEIKRIVDLHEIEEALRYENYLGVYKALIMRTLDYSRRVLGGAQLLSP